MLKIGVLGAGHLGKIHIKCLKELPDVYEIVGFYDPNEKNTKKVSEEFGLKSFSTPEDLIAEVEVVDIVTPTLSHYDCAKLALEKGRHIFIEKPITNTIEEAENLISLVKKANAKAQVGHVERFNPAFTCARPYFQTPRFIETHRLAQFNPRGTDVSVVLDLMIHDLDIILSVVNSDPSRVSASGVAVLSDTPDIANARIEFENGSVANLTASRISMKNMRKSRFFQRDAYIAVDFLDKESEIIRMKEVEGEPDPFAMIIDLGEGKGKKEILFDKPDVQPSNAIKDELAALANSIQKDEATAVTVEDGFKALKLAHMILEKVESSSNLLEKERLTN